MNKKTGNKTRGNKSSNKPVNRGSWRSKDEKDLDKRMSHEKDSGSYQQDAEKLAKDERFRNLFNWYSKNPLLLEAAARVPFPYRPGMSLPLGTFVGQLPDQSSTYNARINIPGLWVINYAHSIGYSDAGTSPVNVAAREMYSKVRSNFSGALDADAPDMMMYVIALASAYSALAYIKRFYGALNRWSPDNFGMPNMVLEAYGLSTSQIQQARRSQPQIWAAINQFALQLNKYRLPKVMPIIDRWQFMNENVYSDNMKMSGQFYMFMPRGFYQIGSDSNQVTLLKYVNAPSGATISNVTGLTNWLDTMLNNLNAWDDAYTIDGYFRKVYPDSEVWQALQIDELYRLEPGYDELVLMQIHNSNTIMGSYTAPNITQDPTTNFIYFTPKASGLSDIPVRNNVMMNLKDDVPSVESVVEASRLISVIDWDSLTGSTASILSGTEIVTDYALYTVDVNANGVVNPTAFYTGGGFKSDIGVIDTGAIISTNKSSLKDMFATGLINTWNVDRYLYAIGAMSSFDWHPIIKVYAQAANSEWPTVTTLADLWNPTVFNRDVLKEINRVCIYSEFNAFGLQ